MGFYDGLAATAKNLLTKFGQDVVRRRFVDGDYDATAGSIAQIPTNTQFKGALFDFGEGTREVRGSLVLTKDKRLLLETAGSPSLSDVFVVAGTQYAVVSMTEINPAGTPVIYDLHLRAG